MPHSLETLETDVRLSDCLLWPLIETFYGEEGPAAFNQTPYYPTNNAFLADTYVDLILSFYGDLAPRLRPDQPIYVIEWAGGAGVLAFMVLTGLREKWAEHPALARFKLTYVLTDFTEKNLAGWQADPQLAPFFETDWLDIALVRPEEDTAYTLLRSKRTLKAGTLAHPPFVIANYFFDSIRHDYFRVRDGQLYEALLKLQRPKPTEKASKPPRASEIVIQERYAPLRDPRRAYPEPHWGEVLRQLMPAQGTHSFLFPTGALSCLDQLCRFAPEGFGLLVSDKGFYEATFTHGEQPVPYTPHTGSFSFAVNYRALEVYLTAKGGRCYKTPEHPPLITFAATTTGLPAHGLFAQAAQRSLTEQAQAQTAFQLALWVEESSPSPRLAPAEYFRSLIAMNRVARYDPWVLAKTGEALCATYSHSEYGAEAQLRQLLKAVESRLHRRAVGAGEASRHLRRLCFILQDFEGCLRHNRRLLAWEGEDRDAFFYPGAIAEARGEITLALQSYRRAHALDPACSITADALRRLEALR